MNAQAPVSGDASARPILGLASRPDVMDECSRSRTRNDSLQTKPVLSNLISISNEGPVTPLVTVAEATVTRGVKWRSGRDSKAPTSTENSSAGDDALSSIEEVDSAATSPLPVTRNEADDVGARLAGALRTWCAERDPRQLRRALLFVLTRIDDI